MLSLCHNCGVSSISVLAASMDLKFTIFILIVCLSLIISARVSPDIEEQHFMEKSAVAVSPPARTPAPAPKSPAPAPIIAHDAKACGDACKGRCSLHSRQKVCNRACMTCCSTCHCVPPGTYGYHELCGTCYSGWLTHGNRTKCP